ncbi:hypothetical protein MACK_003014 [Theileria orientalis]|uniref:RNA binding protein n=1 Tax=Theileria orientalis TaxID=68886 RepID=A0A976MEK5_THEOR|nr:hypothetical protein MACK_003014 [Theileria orientalis]
MLSLIAKLKKQKEAEEEKLRQNVETAKIYAQYVKSFDGTSAEEPLTFVKSDVLDPSKGATNATVPEIFTLGTKDGSEQELDKDEITSTYLSQINAEESTFKKQPKGSKVREIDTFIEEIKEKQRVINERKELQNKILTATTEHERYEINQRLSKIETDLSLNAPDLNSTNIFIGNLSANVTEEILMSHFAKYGQVTGIRIMPLKNELATRPTTSAFLSYVSHAQAENAKNSMDGKEILKIPCKIGWAKNILRPTIAVQNTQPEMGLPYQPAFNSVNTQLPVVNPNVQNLPLFQVFLPLPNHKRKIIDLMSKYVAEAGQKFEQMIMEKEAPNGLFSFLYEKYTPDSVYYRWRVYSLMQGDTMYSWNNMPFKITNMGKIYCPPPVQNKNTSQSGYVPLTTDQERQFENIIANTTTTRNDVCNAMLFFINNSESAYQLTDLLINRLNDESSQVNQKIALLYVLSDVLYNSASSRQFSWIYRTSIEKRLPEIFDAVKKFKTRSKSKIAGQQLSDVIMKLLKTWEDWTVYSSVFTTGLEATLLGDDTESFKSQPEFEKYKDLVDENDGYDMDYFEILSTFPLKYREEAYKYLKMGIKELKSLCFQRGLLLVPSDRRTLVVRLVMYDKYQVDKAAEEKRLELLKAEEEMNEESLEGSDMDESDMDQDTDEAETSERIKIQEATAMLQKTLMEKARSLPHSNVEVEPKVSVPVKPKEEPKVEHEPEEQQPEEPTPEPEETQDDDIDDIFAS